MVYPNILKIILQLPRKVKTMNFLQASIEVNISHVKVNLYLFI